MEGEASGGVKAMGESEGLSTRFRLLEAPGITIAVSASDPGSPSFTLAFPIEKKKNCLTFVKLFSSSPCSTRAAAAAVRGLTTTN